MANRIGTRPKRRVPSPRKPKRVGVAKPAAKGKVSVKTGIGGSGARVGRTGGRVGSIGKGATSGGGVKGRVGGGRFKAAPMGKPRRIGPGGTKPPAKKKPAPKKNKVTPRPGRIRPRGR